MGRTLLIVTAVVGVNLGLRYMRLQITVADSELLAHILAGLEDISRPIADRYINMRLCIYNYNPTLCYSGSGKTDLT